MISKEEFVKRTVAEYGYGLNILIDDEDWHVRRAVAEQDYGLDILIILLRILLQRGIINEEIFSESVRKIAEKPIKNRTQGNAFIKMFLIRDG